LYLKGSHSVEYLTGLMCVSVLLVQIYFSGDLYAKINSQRGIMFGEDQVTIFIYLRFIFVSNWLL